MAFCREHLRRPSRGWSQWIQALGDWIQQVEMKASEGPWSAPFEYPLFVDLVIWFQPLAAQKVEAAEEGCVFTQEQAGPSRVEQGSWYREGTQDFPMHSGPAPFVSRGGPGSL